MITLVSQKEIRSQEHSSPMRKNTEINVNKKKIIPHSSSTWAWKDRCLGPPKSYPFTGIICRKPYFSLLAQHIKTYPIYVPNHMLSTCFQSSICNSNIFTTKYFQSLKEISGKFKNFPCIIFPSVFLFSCTNQYCALIWEPKISRYNFFW